MKLTKGQIVALTEGCYSDYCLTGHVRVLEDFDAKAECDAYKASFIPEQIIYKDWRGTSRMTSPSREEFIASLIRRGFIEDCSVDVPEMYLGEYSGLDVSAG